MPTHFQPTQQTCLGDSMTGATRRSAARAVRAMRVLALQVGQRLGLAQSVEQRSRLDPATSLYNKFGLMAYGDKLLSECEAHQREISVAVFDFADLIEVRSIYGTRFARDLTGVIVQKLLAIAGERGLASRTGLAEFTVVMPELGRDKALAAIRRVLGYPTRIEFEADDNEIVLVPGFALETSGPDIESVEDLYREARMSIDDFQRSESSRIAHLQRSRERHSRPMKLVPRMEPEVAGRFVRRDMAPTTPAPLRTA